ncbi:MAG TPA: hypothetical protein VGR73_17280 [Bryobacteraceae bacterium]|nr:hypothetical protein [Bryobacteraceae bacterium]
MSTTPATPNPATPVPTDCCPALSNEICCDVLDFRYRLPHRVQVNDPAGRVTVVTVEVTLHIRVTRCPGPLFLGDPIHTITLLPGEKVKLFTSDRRTRFTFDSSTKLSYRNEQLSEDKYFMAAVQNSMSDLSVTDSSHSSNSESGKWDFHGDASGSIGFLSASADANANGSHSGQSTADFLRQLSAHATASANQSVQATHASASLSIGEVSTRTHIASESEDHFESSSREFSNPNHCHAVTYYFYRLNRKQIVTITLEAIDRRVDDPAAPTGVSLNPPVSRGQIGVVPANVLATQQDRVAVEQIGRDSVAAQARQSFTSVAAGATAAASNAFQSGPVPLSPAARKAALDQVDKDLVTAGLLTAVGGTVAPAAQKSFEVISESCLPTPGVIVKGCIDDCDTCEPELHRKIQLELDEKELRNKLLQRQVELLDKAQEYRCCPAGDTKESK